MPRMIDQLRASKLPSNMMQFAARGALQVPPAENIEILVHLARHNHVFGDVARLTLAGWDEKASLAVASDPKSPREVLDYFISPDNLRPKLVPVLLENPAISEGQLIKIAIGASRETIQAMIKSPRVKSLSGVLKGLQANPYLEKGQADELRTVLSSARQVSTVASEDAAPAVEHPEASAVPSSSTGDEWADDEALNVYLKEHEHDIAAVGDKPFQAIGGIVDFLGEDHLSDTHVAEAPSPTAPAAPTPVIAPRPAAKGRSSLEQARQISVLVAGELLYGIAAKLPQRLRGDHPGHHRLCDNAHGRDRGVGSTFLERDGLFLGHHVDRLEHGPVEG